MVLGIKMFPSSEGKDKEIKEKTDQVDVIERKVKPAEVHVYATETGFEVEEEPASEEIVVHPKMLIIRPEDREAMRKEIEAEEIGEDLLKVPDYFDDWFKSVDSQSVSVRKAYHLIDEIEQINPKLFDWVSENEDTFAKVWLGAEYRVAEAPRYEVTIPVEGGRPNILAKGQDGFVVFKPFEALLDNDITELTEEEIMPKWSMFMQQEYARLVNPEKI